MINNFGQLQNTITSSGYSIQKNSPKKSIRAVAFFTLIVLYFYFGKWNIFTAFGISTDYLFWFFLAGIIIVFLVFNHKIRIKNDIIPAVVFLCYQLFEMYHSLYRSTAIPVFVFNILTIMVFLFVKERQGYDKLFVNCLFYGGIYYMITILLQAAFPGIVNNIRSILLTSTDTATALRGFENATRYLAGLGANSAITAFFVSMMIGISMSRILLNRNMIKNGIISLLGIVSLFLTQKRSFALGTVLAVFIILFLFKKGIAKKFRFTLAAIILGSIALYIMYRVSPAMTIFIDRMVNNQDLFSGRNNMYEIMATWFQTNPLFGVGIGTANHYFGYGGHNCYRQLLAEEGILGCAIYASLVMPYLYRLLSKLYISWNSTDSHENTEVLLGASICMVIILIYAFVGNPFYDFTFCLTMFMLLAIPTQVEAI